jgi:hypothetical protein
MVLVKRWFLKLHLVLFPNSLEFLILEYFYKTMVWSQKYKKKILCIQTEPSNFLNSRKLNGINIPDQIISIINSGNFLRPPFTLRSFSICLSNNSKELEPD